MPQLLVRKVDEDLIARLKQRAARAGRSAEAEHRLILEAGAAARQAELRRARSPAPGGVARPRAQRQRRADQSRIAIGTTTTHGHRCERRRQMGRAGGSAAKRRAICLAGSLCAPSLWLAEAANALLKKARRGEITQDEARRAGAGSRGCTDRTDRAPDPAAERDAHGGRARPLHLRLLLSGGGIAPRYDAGDRRSPLRRQGRGSPIPRRT